MAQYRAELSYDEWMPGQEMKDDKTELSKRRYDMTKAAETW
jgi:hypothetical protein